MVGEWCERPLGELAENLDSLRIPVKEADRRTGPYPYYGASGIVDYVDSFLFDGEYLLIAEDGENLRTRNTPVAFLASGRFWVNNHAHIVRGNSEADTRFLMYALTGADISGYLTGSTMPKLTQGNMNRIPILTPPLSEQRAIAHILGTLDDKIELNRRMNETLEAMARALFKSWFVDFDPVRAKAAGRDPGLPKPLADLFPDSFEGSALGEIPKGWEVKKLGDLLELAYGKALKAEDRQEGDVPVYGSNGQVGWHNARLVVGPGIVVGRKGNPGIATWVATDFFPIDTTFYVLPKASCQSLEFLFHMLRTHDLASLGADSAVPGLNRNLATMSNQVLPPAELLGHFERFAGELSPRVNCGNEESRTLAALRDTLLPKLISGELQVGDVERFVRAEQG
ncbi:MAG: restriction endonuclease subunit S [Anaerolineae bacterium]